MTVSVISILPSGWIVGSMRWPSPRRWHRERQPARRAAHGPNHSHPMLGQALATLDHIARAVFASTSSSDMPGTRRAAGPLCTQQRDRPDPRACRQLRVEGQEFYEDQPAQHRRGETLSSRDGGPLMYFSGIGGTGSLRSTVMSSEWLEPGPHRRLMKSMSKGGHLWLYDRLGCSHVIVRGNPEERRARQDDSFPKLDSTRGREIQDCMDSKSVGVLRPG
jgi:hypothetical protein